MPGHRLVGLSLELSGFAEGPVVAHDMAQIAQFSLQPGDFLGHGQLTQTYQTCRCGGFCLLAFGEDAHVNTIVTQ